MRLEENALGSTVCAENKIDKGLLCLLQNKAAERNMHYGSAGLVDLPWLREVLDEASATNQNEKELRRKENERRAQVRKDNEGLVPFIWFPYLTSTELEQLIDSLEK